MVFMETRIQNNILNIKQKQNIILYFNS